MNVLVSAIQSAQHLLGGPSFFGSFDSPNLSLTQNSLGLARMRVELIEKWYFCPNFYRLVTELPFVPVRSRSPFLTHRSDELIKKWSKNARADSKLVKNTSFQSARDPHTRVTQTHGDSP